MNRRSLVIGICILIGLIIGIFQQQILLYVAIGMAVGTLIWVFVPGFKTPLKKKK